MDLAGCFVPLLTPLTDDGRLDLDAVAPCVERLLAAGVDGLVALGTTGEFADLTPAERADVAAAVVDAAAGRVPVLVGVGGVGTTEARAHARAAAAAGADAVLSLPPLYWKLGDGALLRHAAAVAGATDLPLLLYDFPSLAGTSWSPVLVARIAAEVDQVVGIKPSGPELRFVHALVAAVKPQRPDFRILVGAADLVLPAMLAGADGTIAAIANVFPEAMVELVGAARSGDLARAAQVHRRVLRLLAVPALSTPPILALKAAAQALGAPLRPVVRTQPDDAETVIAAATDLAPRLAGP
jgi:2-dehydro-3-deoxy-D-pentonate aldolase